MWFKDIGKFATDKIKFLSNKNNDIPLDELLKNIDVKKDKKYDYAQSLQSILNKTPSDKNDIKSMNTGWEAEEIDINFNENKEKDNKLSHDEPRTNELIKKEQHKSNNDEKIKENSKTQKQTAVTSDKDSFETLLMKDFENENIEKPKIFSKLFGISSYLTKNEKNEKVNAGKKNGEENLQELLEENKYLEEKLQSTLIQSSQLDLLLKIEKEEFEEYRSIESEKMEVFKKDLESQAQQIKNRSQELEILEKKIIFKKKLAVDEAKLDDIILENIKITEISNGLTLQLDQLKEDHMKEIEKANMTISNLHTKNTNNELKLKKSFVKLAAASTALKEQLTKIHHLKAEANSLKNYLIEESTANSSIMEANLNEYRSKYIKMNEKLFETKENYHFQIERLNETLSLSTKNELNLENKLQNLENEYQKQLLYFEQALSESSIKNNRLLNDNLALTNQIESLSESIASLQKENMSIKKINDENESNNKKKISTLEKELQSFLEQQNKLISLQKIKEDLNQKFMAQKKLNEELIERNSNNEISQKNSLLQKDEEISILKSKVGQSRDIIANLEKNVNSRDSKIFLLEFEIQNLKKESDENERKNNLKSDNTDKPIIVKEAKLEKDSPIQENCNWEVDDDILLEGNISLETPSNQNQMVINEDEHPKSPKILEEINFEFESVEKKKENEKSNKIFEENIQILPERSDVHLVGEIKFERSVELSNEYKVLETDQKDELNELEDLPKENTSENYIKLKDNNEFVNPATVDADKVSDFFFNDKEKKEEILIQNHEENFEDKQDLEFTKEDESNLKKEHNLPDNDQNVNENDINHYQEVEDNIFKEENLQFHPEPISTIEQKLNENLEISNTNNPFQEHNNNEIIEEKKDEINFQIKCETLLEEKPLNEENEPNFEIQNKEPYIESKKNEREEIFIDEENNENQNKTKISEKISDNVNQNEFQALSEEKANVEENEAEKNTDFELNLEIEMKNEGKAPSEKTLRSYNEGIAQIKIDNSLDMNDLNNLIEPIEEDNPKNEKIEKENNFQPLEEDSIELNPSNKKQEIKREADQNIHESPAKNEINLQHPNEIQPKSNIPESLCHLFQSKEFTNPHDWDIDDLKLDIPICSKESKLIEKELDLPKISSSFPKNDDEFSGSIKTSHQFTYNLQKALEMSKSDAKTVEELKFDDDLFGAQEKSQSINLSNEKDVKSCSAFSAQHSPQKSIESKANTNLMEVKSNNDFFSSGFKNESLEQKSLLIKKAHPVLSNFVINKNLMNNLKGNLSTNDMKQNNFFDLNKKKEEDIDLFSLLGNNKRK